MITCGEALEMVRMAMCEDGFKPAADRLLLRVPPSEEFVQGEPSFRLTGVSSDEEAESFYRACLLMYRLAGVNRARCFYCFLAEAPRDSCTHQVVLT